MVKSLTLIIPEFNPDLKRFPVLKKLLARAKSMPIQYESDETLLWDLVNKLNSVNPPFAALTGLADGLVVQEDYWLRADPVELRADLAAVYFMGNRHLQLNSQEIKQIVDAINPLLEQDGLKLHAPEEKRWYISCDFDPNIITHPPSTLWGKDILSYLPQGSGGKHWPRLLTEIQMLLLTHPVNLERVKQNKPPVNSLWFWGAGRLPKCLNNNWQKIWSNDALARGLAMLNKNLCEKEPTALEDCLLEMKLEGDYLVTLTGPNETTLEEKWFLPLIRALQKRKINSLTMLLNRKSIYYINDKTIWFFWKK